MQVQVKNNKGFTTLEVIVVLAIVGVLAAISFPRFDDWSKKREIQAELIRAITIFNNINSQVQRGLYAFVQVKIAPEEDDDGNDVITIVSRGMKANTLANYIATDTERNFIRKDDEARCLLDQNEWDDSGDTPGKPEVGKVELKELTTSPSLNKPVVVCFSKDGRWYSSSASLSDQKLNLNGKGGYCDKVDERTEAKKCEYRITWTRFGSAKLEKKMSFKNNEGKITSNWVGQ